VTFPRKDGGVSHISDSSGRSTFDRCVRLDEIDRERSDLRIGYFSVRCAFSHAVVRDGNRISHLLPVSRHLRQLAVTWPRSCNEVCLSLS